MKHTLLLVMIFIIAHLHAQISDDFEDGNFDENPEWLGNQQLFKVNSALQLQLNDDKENHCYLATENHMIINTEWRCWIKLAFSPSSNNYARYYLVSDNQNLMGPLNGYFLQFGESGSGDAVELFRQDGTNYESVCRGAEGSISSSFEIRVKVTRNESGNWKLYIDQSGGENFSFECEGIDNTYMETSTIGFVCKYTSSNSTKMYFDNVYAGPIIVDNEPPILLVVTADSDSTISLQFNEVISESSAVINSNYYVDNGVGNPHAAIRNEDSPSQILLWFTNKFTLGKYYSISVSGVEDLAENLMEPAQIKFVYYLPQPYDIIINEIMADPTPPINLPEYEYVELYNKTALNIDLSGWTIVIGTSEKEFGLVVLEPNGYLILAKEISADDFISYGNFYGFSSFSLTNSGQSIQLISDLGEIISSITYSDSWYHDSEKEDGGWSMEQRNPENLCSDNENWAASIDPRGGTPGSLNSISSDIILLPKLNSIEILTNNIIQLYFSQKMDPESLENKNAYEVDGEIGAPTHVFTYPDEPNKTELYFDNTFAQGLSYELTISSSITNCMLLNLASDTTIVFGLPDIASDNDVVINEILFNPWTNGEDYVELYNRSDKIIDLSSLKIGSIKKNPPNPIDTSIYSIIANQKILLPDEYMVLTVSPDAVKSQYHTNNKNAFIKVDPFPTFNNDKGHVIIQSIGNVLIDSFSYSEELQFPLLGNYDGVALERINSDISVSDNSNWHSASERVGFGTPGYRNSQFVPNTEVEENIVIEPEIFSPDNDGYDDIINIKYKFDTPGYVMSITIYNANGYQIRKLVNNEYVGTTGSFSWDGIQDNNSKAPIGIYIFYISIFDEMGNVKKYKKTGVLATKL